MMAMDFGRSRCSPERNTTTLSLAVFRYGRHTRSKDRVASLAYARPFTPLFLRAAKTWMPACAGMTVAAVSSLRPHSLQTLRSVERGVDDALVARAATEI